MSAITKPFIHSTRTIANPSGVVNSEEVSSIEKFTERGHVGSNTPSLEVFGIKFSMKRWNDTPREITWRYTLEADRNTDFTAIIAAISTVIP